MLIMLLFSRVLRVTVERLTSCSVMFISSSCCRNCSRMYFGAMSTKDCKTIIIRSTHTIHACLYRTCLADGVMPVWTTMMARVMFSSCIRWQYIFMVLMPTLGSSVWMKNAPISAFETFKVTRTRASDLTREENKHLVGGVVVVGDQHGEIRPSGSPLTGPVTELTFKLIQGLVQLILGHQKPSIVAELQQNSTLMSGLFVQY